MFEEYFEERESLLTFKHDHGFATYTIYKEEKLCFIKDIYVEKGHRKDGIASLMADEISNQGRVAGCSHLVGQCDISTNGPEQSTLALLHYGFKFWKIDGTIIMFLKEL